MFCRMVLLALGLAVVQQEVAHLALTPSSRSLRQTMGSLAIMGERQISGELFGLLTMGDAGKRCVFSVLLRAVHLFVDDGEQVGPWLARTVR